MHEPILRGLRKLPSIEFVNLVLGLRPALDTAPKATLCYASAMSAGSRRTFQQLVTLPDGAIPLAEAALLMACEEYPQLQISPYLDQLDEIADATRPHLHDGASPQDTANIISEILFEEFGFKGNSENYYDPRNSFFNDVLDRRMGIPITLSAVYMEVARRLNFPVWGVGMPGHFIVKYTDANEEFFMDPFFKGEILSAEDCRERFSSTYGASIKFSDRLLGRVTHRQILLRMLHNLKRIYVESQTFDKGLSIIEMMLMIEPDDIIHYRDRGLVKVQLKQFESAAKDLEHYVKSAADGEDRAKVEEQLKELRRIQAMMN